MLCYTTLRYATLRYALSGQRPGDALCMAIGGHPSLRNACWEINLNSVYAAPRHATLLYEQAEAGGSTPSAWPSGETRR